jgi:uncharacterized protein (TIGR02266 family)
LENDRSQALSFPSLSEVARWFAQASLGQGLWLPFQDAKPGERLAWRLQGEGAGVFGAQARVEEVDPISARARCTITPRADLSELLARHALERRAGRQSQPGSLRSQARFTTCLKARFRSFQQLVTEYVANISAGGMFLRTPTPPPVGTELAVQVSFPDGEVQEVLTQVVWRVEPDPSRPERLPGVGVRFLEEGPFHAALDQLLATYLRRRPRVLLVDDDPFFLRVLADALLGRGLEVATAENGLRASHLISKLLYDLDLVVLDLAMPRLDGRALLERLRRLGGERDLRIALVSASSDEVLAALVGPHGADDAIPKGEGLPRIVDRLVALVHGGP